MASWAIPTTARAVYREVVRVSQGTPYLDDPRDAGHAESDRGDFCRGGFATVGQVESCPRAVEIVGRKAENCLRRFRATRPIGFALWFADAKARRGHGCAESLHTRGGSGLRHVGSSGSDRIRHFGRCGTRRKVRGERRRPRPRPRIILSEKEFPASPTSGKVMLTAAGELLCSDHPESQNLYFQLEGASARMEAAERDLLYSVRTGQPAYAHAKWR